MKNKNTWIVKKDASLRLSYVIERASDGVVLAGITFSTAALLVEAQEVLDALGGGK